MEEEKEGGEMDRYVDSENNLWKGRKTAAVHEAGRTVYDRSSSLLLDYMGCTED